jgi:hypothetical protein
MRFRKAIIAVLGISMAGTPVLAQQAAPLSIAGGASRMGAPMAGALNIDEDDNLLVAGALIAIMAAVILWTSNKSSNHSNPVSP